MTTILGIDPGSRITGYGVIKVEGNHHRYIASGCIRLQHTSVSDRLLQIFQGLGQVIEKYRPVEAAIEQVFMHRNASAAIKLGQARGAAMVACSQAVLDLAEYSAREVKQSVVGYGAADKSQVQHMVCRLLNLSSEPQADAADALAIALCHAQTRATQSYLEELK